MLENAQCTKVRPWSTRFLSVLAIFRVDLTTFAKQWKKWYFAFIPLLVMKTFFFPFFFSSLCFYWCSKQKVVNQSERLKHRSRFLKAPLVISEFTRQDGRKNKEDGKTLVRDESDKVITCVLCRYLHLTLMFSGRFSKISVQRKVKFGEELFQTKLLSRLSHKLCRLLSSPDLLLKFTINTPWLFFSQSLVLQLQWLVTLWWGQG